MKLMLCMLLVSCSLLEASTTTTSTTTESKKKAQDNKEVKGLEAEQEPVILQVNVGNKLIDLATIPGNLVKYLEMVNNAVSDSSGSDRTFALGANYVPHRFFKEHPEGLKAVGTIIVNALNDKKEQKNITIDTNILYAIEFYKLIVYLGGPMEFLRTTISALADGLVRELLKRDPDGVVAELLASQRGSLLGDNKDTDRLVAEELSLVYDQLRRACDTHVAKNEAIQGTCAAYTQPEVACNPKQNSSCACVLSGKAGELFTLVHEKGVWRCVSAKQKGIRLSWNRNGTLLAAVHPERKRRVQLFSCKDQKLVPQGFFEIPALDYDEVSVCAWDPQRMRLACGAPGQYELWYYDEQERKWKQERHFDVTGQQSTAVDWFSFTDTGDFKYGLSLSGISRTIPGLISPGEHFVAQFDNSLGLIKISALTKEGAAELFDIKLKKNADISCLAWTPDETILAIGFKGPKIELWQRMKDHAFQFLCHLEREAGSEHLTCIGIDLREKDRPVALWWDVGNKGTLSRTEWQVGKFMDMQKDPVNKRLIILMLEALKKQSAAEQKEARAFLQKHQAMLQKLLSPALYERYFTQSGTGEQESKDRKDTKETKQS